jgi:filamentous hemagglutinin
LIGRYGQVDSNGQGGLVLDGHSRGALTVANAMATSLDQNGPGSAQGLTVNFFGPAANATNADKNLAQLQNREPGDTTRQLYLEAHQNDFVARIIGLNPATGGTPSLNSDGAPRSAWQEWLNMFGGGVSVHNCYGSGRAGCQVYWAQLQSTWGSR